LFEAFGPFFRRGAKRGYEDWLKMSFLSGFRKGRGCMDMILPSIKVLEA